MKAAIIYLLGFMGCGKTSVGRRLSELAGWDFIDLDSEIEEHQGIPIREIFRQHGESYFRSIERAELQSASRRKEVVVALGGGTFCSEENLSIVKATGVSVWLDADIDLLYARCAGDDTRPLFTTRDEMEALLRRRLPLYTRADLRIDVTGLTVDAAAETILHLCSANS